ncbi:MAG TPA: hypothetical protein VD836_12185 [Solirubrobacteraceae bacterium]|nr:hypothetical protein [Solirubrobacteraceae bacterium]
MTDHTSPVLRCAYVEVALFGDGLGARALEACARADVEVVAVGGGHGAALAWIDEAGTLHLDGEPVGTDGIADAVARHRRARACEREDTLGVARALDLAPAVGTCWLAGAVPGEDPLLALELERHPNVRLAEGHGEAAFYEAVVTTLMERRS